MQGCNLQALVSSSSRVVKFPFSAFTEGSPPCPSSSNSISTTTITKVGIASSPRFSFSLRHRDKKKITVIGGAFRAQSYNADIGTGGFVGDEENDQKFFSKGSVSDDLSKLEKPPGRDLFRASLAGLLLTSSLVVSFIAFVKGGHSVLLDAIAKSGFTAAFTLIFVSEIGDKTFFIAALLAMQYAKGLVLLGSMGALSLMTILSVLIGRIFHSVPAQFQTTLPIGEYAAVALLMFFGFKSIKDAWEIQPGESNKKDGPELGEYIEAEELVKEKVAKKLTNPLEIIWKSFSLVFFAEWGDRSMLATIALGAVQSPLGVASGAIVGHLIATSIAILGGAFLANYISEKLAGYLGGALFLIFALATLVGVF